ncbi:putative alpha-1,2-mannosidase [Chitinophaga terrae (ex Kim and Jung 2007)]|uniref:GH92 family glycosyl hydrolase n=1 Tax=Chitinophaga terrae (ex Kim and Jung 2007) TaxID=408074 RepID=UPI002783E1FC|nr:GH92 family glycosyl hydrolase [Chitinophaga terrae (ex Kim and Jung 2007)]MDQ0108779.1 putative alpha-1,2-mannosidase [Chitinophaga terrae (ex Kim and Jung 2007)]
MKKTTWKLCNLLLLAPFACFAGGTATVKDTLPANRQNIDFIDPTIGNVGQLLEPTRPTVQLPNQMIRFTPQRKDYMDDQISDFPLNVVSHRLGQVFSIKPAIGSVNEEAWNNRMAYDHDLEINRPWYYSTWLLDEEVNIEFTAGQRTGYYRFKFPAEKAKSLLLGVYNDGDANYQFLPGNAISALETYNGDVKVYMYGVFSESGTPGTLENGALTNNKSISGKGIRAYISFPAATKEVTFKYAISYISPEQAKKNYEQEISRQSFDAVAENGKKAWSDVMSQIRVKGGTPAQLRSFYTALYRCYERPVNITEDGQYYSGYDKKIHQDKRTFYVDDWTWDTYLALHPLRTILDPAKEEDILQSFVRMYEQSGWMPTFPVLFGDHACMNGFHSSVVMLDGYRKGLRNFDVEKAYEGMRKNATEATMLPWRNGPKTSLEDIYYSKGYFPALRPGEKETEPAVHSFEKRQAVAVTLGAAYDDWALAELAGDLNKKNDQNLFAPRAKNYKNLWNPDKQFFLPKDAKGDWININVKYDGGLGGREFYDENNGWTYLWQVQQDIPGLINLMGGKQAFEKRLDQLFREPLDMSRYAFWSKFPDATGLVGQYSMGNEPSFHIPYLYNYAGAPWKTQQRIRFLLDTWFKDNIFGIPGDEDGGGMSAFVVFSSMGFYPVTPGLPEYAIGSPVFEKVSIALPNKKQFTVIAHNSSKVNKYIQQAKFNGKPLNKPTFTHQQLVEGGTLELFMGPKPNKSWGVF